MLGEDYEARLNNRQKKKSMKDPISLEEAFFLERKLYENEITEIFETKNDPIDFKVDDMLRAKCLFSGVDKINECCQEILNTLNKQDNKDLKLIKLSNRLKKPTSDINIKILFGNVIAELQLAILLNHAEYEFQHKLYEIRRSKFFTKLTQLSILNEEITNEYLKAAKRIIEINTNKKEEDYELAVSFKEVSQYFELFLQKLPVKINFPEEI